MILNLVNRQTDNLYVSPVEFRLNFRHITQFAPADWGKIFRMREQHSPRVADPLMKANTPLGCFRLKVRCCVADSQNTAAFLHRFVAALQEAGYPAENFSTVRSPLRG